LEWFGIKIIFSSSFIPFSTVSLSLNYLVSASQVRFRWSPRLDRLMSLAGISTSSGLRRFTIKAMLEIIPTAKYLPRHGIALL